MDYEFIEIEKDLIPYRFDISLADEMFTFEVHYNEEFDFFTVNLERNGEILAVGEKLIYGMPLFYDVQDNRFPKVPIVPLDESEQQSDVNWQTLNESVFLFVIEGDEDE
ncbi:phage baseplate plug family protein [Paenibacillus sp. SAF-054]|uniref:phage baseplate plug family protein n=1 Tax=unclassified Paenibacillus TaxID=185978 RepID=UPI003F7DF7CF